MVAAPGWLGWRSTRRLGSALAAALRLACFGVLVVVIAGPLIPTRGRARGLAVVALLDQSRSIAPDQREWMQAQIDRLRAMMGPHDRLAIVDFGRNAQLSAGLDNPRVIQTSAAKVDAGATDIAGALTAGSVVFPPEAEKKMLLLSD